MFSSVFKRSVFFYFRLSSFNARFEMACCCSVRSFLVWFYFFVIMVVWVVVHSGFRVSVWSSVVSR